jgi:DNA-binding NarL/FixJ family response regulator
MSTLISRHEALTPREVEVVAQILDGNSNQKIAGQLGLASGTIKVYVAHIFEKLGVSSRVELIIRYARGK